MWLQPRPRAHEGTPHADVLRDRKSGVAMRPKPSTAPKPELTPMVISETRLECLVDVERTSIDILAGVKHWRLCALWRALDAA